MAKDPAFLFYSSDFLAGTQDLTMEERGQYITLLCLQHQKGRLTEKMIRLCCGNATADVMAKFRQDNEGLFFNERLEEEIGKRKNHSDKQRVRAIEGWKKRKNNDCQTDATAHATAYTTADAAAMPNNIYINNNTITKLEDIVISKTSNELEPILKEKEKETESLSKFLITHPLQVFIRDNCPQVSKLKKQITAEECEKLLAKFNNTEIADTLVAMENFKQLTTKYVSVYLTLNNWLNRRPNESTTRNNPNNRGANYEDALRNFKRKRNCPCTPSNPNLRFKRFRATQTGSAVCYHLNRIKVGKYALRIAKNGIVGFYSERTLLF